MIVFLRNIPDDTLRSEIVAFVEPALNGGFFKAKGKIIKIEILGLRDKDINLVEYHALVYIEPDSAALRAIKKLHGQRFRNKRLTVRQYMLRDWKNDRRRMAKDVPMQIKEKRKSHDRRRNLEIIEALRPQFFSSKRFHRIQP